MNWREGRGGEVVEEVRCEEGGEVVGKEVHEVRCEEGGEVVGKRCIR